MTSTKGVRTEKDSSQKKREQFSLKCYSCSKVHSIDDYGRGFYFCTACNGLLEIRLSLKDRYSSFTGTITINGSGRNLYGVWKYVDLIPLWNEENIVSMQEGGTPLVNCATLASKLGFKAVYVKFEGLNPTGSFKDRGMTVGISKGKELGFKRVMCASTGNTSASLAAYSARSGLSCTVLVPKGKIALGKIAQAIVYGARIVQVDGNFDDCLNIAMEYCERDREALLLNSLNPFRIEGQKTTSFEIANQLSLIPENIILPIGNGGNISSIWKGFEELAQFSLHGKESTLPRMIGVQAEGAAPIVKAFLSGAKTMSPVMNPDTVASAINIGSPVNWARALGALYRSKGTAASVSDEEILEAQKFLASEEGLFVEPASATPIAFLLKISKKEDAWSRDQFYGLKDSSIVCIATGNGLKDPDSVTKNFSREKMISLESRDVDTIRKVMFTT